MMSNHSELSRSAPAKRLMHDTIKLAALAACLGVAVGLAPLAISPAHAGDTAHLTINGNAFGSTRDISIGPN